jgi:nucleoid-associated protein YgaU
MQQVQILKQVNGNYETVVDCVAQFNPEKLKLDKKASWKTEKTWKANIGNTVFAGGDPIKLSVELFFDTTATEDGDVRQYTDALMSLTLVDLSESADVISPEELKKQIEAKKKALERENKIIEDANKKIKEYLDTTDSSGASTTSRNRANNKRRNVLWPAQERKKGLEREIAELENQSKGRAAGSKGAPPKVKFVWGDFSFIAIVESVKVTFLMFRPDGTPVRAKAKVKMKQIEEETLHPPQNPTSRSAARKVWVVQEGQRLDWIAYQEYGDSAMWRYIAEINKLDNPMKLQPGQILDLI